MARRESLKPAPAPVEARPEAPGRIEAAWGLSSAVLGGAAWIALLFGFVGERFPVPAGLIALLFLLAPLVVVPLGIEVGLRLGALSGFGPLFRAGRLLQPLGAALAVLAFWLPRNVGSGLLASVWLLVCLLLGASGAGRLVRRRGPGLPRTCLEPIPKPLLASAGCGGVMLRRASSPDASSLGLGPTEEFWDWLFAAGLAYLPLGGTGLLFSRLGMTPLGFEEPVVLLFAVHFHFSTFAASFLTGALGTRIGPELERLFRVIAGGVVLSPLLVAAGFVLHSPLLKLIAVSVLVASLLGLALLHLPVLPAVRPLPARLLLGLSAVSVGAGMALAAVYAVGEFREEILIDIPRMAVSHGILNGLGFSAGGMIAWLLAGKESP